MVTLAFPQTNCTKSKVPVANKVSSSVLILFAVTNAIVQYVNALELQIDLVLCYILIAFYYRTLNPYALYFLIS